MAKAALGLLVAGEHRHYFVVGGQFPVTLVCHVLLLVPLATAVPLVGLGARVGLHLALAVPLAACVGGTRHSLTALESACLGAVAGFAAFLCAFGCNGTAAAPRVEASLDSQCGMQSLAGASH